MKRSFNVFLAALLASQLARAQPCDASLKAVENDPYAYKQRGDLCEGFYRSKVTAPDIDVVGVMQGRLYYDLDSLESIEIYSPVIKDDTVFVRAQAIPLKTYYRMDAILAPHSTVVWPVNSVLLPKKLSSKKIGLMGWIMDDGRRIFVPLKTKAKVSTLESDDIVRVIFRPTVDIENIQYAWISERTKESTGWKQNLRNTCRAGMPFVIKFQGQMQGMYRLSIAAKKMRTPDEWISTEPVNLIPGQP